MEVTKTTNISIIKNNQKKFECVYWNPKIPNLIPFLNALRRISFSEIPTFAIDKILKFEDDALDPDEKVMQKIGIIPITYPGFDFVKNFVSFHKCKCQETENLNDDNETIGCANCTLKFEIKLTCPLDKEAIPIRAADIVFQSQNPYFPKFGVFQDFYVNGVHLKSNPIISYVLKGKTFHVVCYAIKGTGNIHAKWSPIVQWGIRQLKAPNPIDPKKINSWAEIQKSDFVDSCPKAVFKLNGSVIDIEDSFPCDECNECLDFCEQNSLQKVTKIVKQKKFHFFIETVGPMKPLQILKISNILLQEKCKKYIDILKK